MKINHIALYTNNLDEMREYYEKYFNATSNHMYHNINTGLKTYFLTFEDNTRLELMTRPDLEQHVSTSYQRGYIHLAFSVGSKEKVDTLTSTLAHDGYIVVSQPRTTGDGYYESCVLDPEGNQIELVE